MIGYEALPDAAERLREALELQRAAAGQGTRVDVRTSAGRVRLSYLRDGQPVEEWDTGFPGKSAFIGGHRVLGDLCRSIL